MMFKTVDEAINWVVSQKKDNKRYSLDELKDALKLLGSPDKDLKVIHIGGTNGKGSVSAYLSNILQTKDLKVGLYVSPFVVKFNERISINNNYISDTDLLNYINKMFDFNESFKLTHSNLAFFEILTLIAFLYFNDNNCDICVFEVGLGGRLDATNVVNPLVSAITNIQKDHMKELGNTYKKILVEKLGIVKQSTPFVTCIKKPMLMQTIKDTTNNLNSELHLVRNIRNININENGTNFYYKGIKYHSPLIGIHQASNASLAIEIILTLNKHYDFNISNQEIQLGLNNTKWPGRFEIINGFILDGAHNKEGQLALKNTLSQFTNKKIITIFAAMKDKETNKMVNILDSYSEKTIFTEIPYPRCEKASNLIKLSQKCDNIVFINPDKAIEYAINNQKSTNLIVFTGSLYFISYIRNKLLKED